jgi:tol-pal system protein YbgF
MSISNKALVAFFFLLSAGCASRGDVDVMQHDLDELKTRYFNLEKDFNGLKSETLKDYQTEFDSLRKGTADLQASLESAKVDMQVLAGKVDDANIQAKKPEEDIKLLKDDLDRRFTALESRLETLEKNIDSQKKADDSSGKQDDNSPDTLYRQGVEQIKAGNTREAREILTDFTEKYPKHDLTANAHYWIGESYYIEKSYDQAILEFEKVIKNYPDRGKVPASLFKQGMAFKAIGDKKSCKYILNKLIEKYPKSAEAASAKAKLKAIK